MGLADALDSLPAGARTPREKLLEALEMYDEGVAIQRETLRRRHPDLSAEQLEHKLWLWLCREDPT